MTPVPEFHVVLHAGERLSVVVSGEALHTRVSRRGWHAQVTLHTLTDMLQPRLLTFARRSAC